MFIKQGVNGSGKTSLSQVIASTQIPNFPSKNDSSFVVQYVSAHDTHAQQDDDDSSDDDENELTPVEYLHTAVKAKNDMIQNEIDKLEESMDNDDDDNGDGDTGNKIEEIANRLSELYDIQDELNETSERTISNILKELQFEPHLHKSISQLSSGWKYKCQLAKIFTIQPDILIVDEPSFLDSMGMEWFITRLKTLAVKHKCMVLFISHKEQILEELCDRILYINSTSKTLTLYSSTTYNKFRDLLQLQTKQAQNSIQESKANVKSAEGSLKKIKIQLQKREKNYNTTNSKHNNAINKRFIKGKNKESKQNADKCSASKLKQLKQKATDIESNLKNQSKKDFVKPLTIKGVEGPTGTIGLLQNVKFKYTTTDTDDDNNNNNNNNSPLLLFNGLDARLEYKDRILLKGPNGCGKTTLIKLLLNELQPIDGTITLKGGGGGDGNNDTVLYFPQTSLQELTYQYGNVSATTYLNTNTTTTTTTTTTIQLTETQTRQHLGNFGLKNDLALRRIVTLSSGQKVRLWLAKQLLYKPNPCLLIMDEISENLDIETRSSLIQILNSFVGATIVVSHDYDFCSNYKPTQIWNLGESKYGLIRIEYP